MKKIKIISAILIVIILIEYVFIAPTRVVYANPTDDEGTGSPYTSEDTTNTMTNTIGTDVTEKGQVDGIDSGVVTAALGTICGLLCTLINLVIVQIDVAISSLSYTTTNDTDKIKVLYGGEMNFWISLEKIVFNRIAILNYNYFDLEDTYKVGDITYDSNSTNKSFKEGVAKAYVIMRVIAAALAVVVFIYVGIRMALSTVGEQQGKYKQMLISCVVSMAILFGMKYIIAATFMINNALIDVLANIEYQLIENSTSVDDVKRFQVFEAAIRDNLVDNILGASGLTLVYWSIIYYVMLFSVIKFFFMYIKRFFTIGFLIVISPIITVLYPIDKAGDGSAQTFNVWMKEFFSTVFRQTLHCMIYLIFLLTANAFATRVPILGIIFLLCIPTVEKMFMTIFQISFSTLAPMHEMKLLKK